MRVLVACEFSATVREAFSALGHDAWSCDLLPTKILGQHIQGDVLSILNDGWDLMVAHPPCTYLTISANQWYKDQPPRKSGALVGAERRAAREDALAFFMEFMNAPIPKIAVENPIGVISFRFRKPDQVLQPWMFGHKETKATCLWLKGLPKLTETNNVKSETMALPESERMRLHYLSATKDRSYLRSVTFQGIADAMANQ